MGGPNDSYDILGLAPGASPEEVKEAYIELAKVWRPDRFPNGDRLRPIAERKMAEIDAAYLDLKTFFRSNGHGRSPRNRRNSPKAGSPEGRGRENRVYAEPVAAAGGICELCGKPSVPRELRYAIYCPSCGTLNFLKSKKDYHRGTCAECRAPFRVQVKFNPTTSRRVAYPVLLAVLSAFVWFFFLSGGGGNYTPERRPVSVSAPQPVLANNLSAARDKPPAPIAGRKKETPLPVVSAPLNAAPSPVAATPLHEAPAPSAAPAASVVATVGRPAPVLPGCGAAPKAPEKKPDHAGAVHPDSVQEKSNERYEELIEHVLKQKSIDSQKGINDLTVIPLNDSPVEQK